jgi:hypothetical protein
MTSARHPATVLIFPAFAVGVVFCSMAVVRSVAFSDQPGALASAVTLDLALGLPLLGYLFLVRAGRAPALVLAPLFVLGNVLARLLVPREHQMLLRGLELVVVAVELALLGFVVWRIGRLIRHIGAARAEHPYLTDAWRAGASTALGGSPLVAFATTELVVLAAAFTGWFRRPSLPAELAPFSVVRAGGTVAFFSLILAVVPIELVVLHVLIAKMSAAAAWVVTALGIYGAIWLLGDFHIMRLEPIGVGAKGLHVRVGIRSRVRVPLSNVVDVSRRAPVDDGTTVNLSVLGEPDLWVTLREPVTVDGLFGRSRSGRVLGLPVADPDGLAAAIAPRTESPA